ncbi:MULTISPECIES: LacI family DNA-binding transcriptional regulator [unclassified Novosphingobium]|uniref:LacI family DNA-binding transcriptional regulator n=1 Tax=unclassified Novosphingobium TaxID=2644732 RepID=UPI00086C206F|nr:MULTISPECIES: LacI family DNA-binding transcriptional regulator [unclassified Novosphingobium]MDR6707339.1 LacI family transcriptional regulator [Novosphingobium sp. 1748]NKI98406.1 LacI family transcriptional regulator [Novosphingobium sp. SG707]ODU83298.1 MAG: LacI family transcriptional regulator [Novosphingobium sp. SCN 63-17]OJX96433.1 MAG: LacI family transcriptional regulator [Novosphingobium sp. 63-713]
MARSDRSGAGATIIDVARLAGVSAMTVSRVINGREGVRPETREAVEKAIRELSYTPNVAARSLVTSTELQVGVIYSNPSAAFMSEFLTGIFEEASIRGARLSLLKGEAGKAPGPEALEQFAAAGLSGFILAPPLGESRRILSVLEPLGRPIAAVGAYKISDALCVRIDNHRAAYEMTRHLLDLGHRRLGFILGNPDQAASAERMAGFYAAVREIGGVDVRVAQGDFSYTSGLAAGELLLDAPSPPTAIFASNDDMAAAVVSVAHRRQIDVPGALTVVGFDDTAAAVTLWPTLTTVHQPLRRLAAEALAYVAQEAGPALLRPGAVSDCVLDHSIVYRDSTARISVAEPD